MNPTFTDFSATPKSLHYDPNLPPPTKTEPATKEAFKTTTNFTKTTAKVVFSPKYSLFVNGIKLMCDSDDDDGFLSGLGTGIGVLLVMASPISLVLKMGLGVPTLAASAVASAATSAAHGAELVGRKVKKLTSPTQTDLQKEHLASKFVERMHSTLDDLPYNKRVFFQENPEQLIMISAIAVAFKSRGLDGKFIQTGDDKLSLEDISGMDKKRKGYFNKLCEMKLAIQDLKLSSDEELAWGNLMSSLEGLEEVAATLESQSSYEKNRIETLLLLLGYAMDLSEQVMEDEVFQKAWNNSL